MQTPAHTPPSLAEYVDLQALQQTSGMPQTFPTLDSIRWFVRMHRAALVAQGAMILVAGRQRFHPALFQQTAIEIGRRAASIR